MDVTDKTTKIRSVTTVLEFSCIKFNFRLIHVTYTLEYFSKSTHITIMNQIAVEPERVTSTELILPGWLSELITWIKCPCEWTLRPKLSLKLEMLEMSNIHSLCYVRLSQVRLGEWPCVGMRLLPLGNDMYTSQNTCSYYVESSSNKPKHFYVIYTSFSVEHRKWNMESVS